KTRTYLGLLTLCLALHGSQRMKLLFKINNRAVSIKMYKKIDLFSCAGSKRELKSFKDSSNLELRECND
ncbi:hypothetical protein, partial [Piscirickettsia salmonis]|uniref:hypothetical protein n=1 Tax=Piscirickettsia salmonis TaxID=1238 RepID=UPI001B809AB1